MTPVDIYKYCDARGTDILLNLRLKITPPNRFNDPFEFAPIATPTVARKEARLLIKARQTERELFEQLIAEGRFTGNFKSFKKAFRPQRERMIEAVTAKYPSVAADFRTESVNIASQEFGLLCLSAVRDNILMWSHYSHGHTGLVIGFDGRHPILGSGSADLVEVEYRKQRVEMEYLAAPQSRKFHDQVHSLIRRKSPLWCYECEWRQLRSLRQCETVQDASSGWVNHFFSIEPKLVRQVIIGCRASEALIHDVAAIKTAPHFNHVQFLRARMHTTDFALEFSPF